MTSIIRFNSKAIPIASDMWKVVSIVFFVHSSLFVILSYSLEDNVSSKSIMIICIAFMGLITARLQAGLTKFQNEIPPSLTEKEKEAAAGYGISYLILSIITSVWIMLSFSGVVSGWESLVYPTSISTLIFAMVLCNCAVTSILDSNDRNANTSIFLSTLSVVIMVGIFPTAYYFSLI